MLFQSYQRALFAIAYRMLGTASDAEDIVQDTFADFQYAGLRPDVKDPKAYLCKIVYNKSKDHLRTAAQMRQSYAGPWLPEPLLTESPSEYYLRQESLTTAYLLLLQELSETERAVFILREVGEFHYAEIAMVVEKTESNCRQIYRRAKQKLENRGSQQLANPSRLKPLVEQFVRALQTGNLETLMRVLSDDVVFTADSGGQVPGSLVPVRTAQKVAQFLMKTSGMVPEGMRTDFEQVNGQWGLVLSRGEELLYVFTFSFRKDRIEAIYTTANPDKLVYIGRQRWSKSVQGSHLC